MNDEHSNRKNVLIYIFTFVCIIILPCIASSDEVQSYPDQLNFIGQQMPLAWQYTKVFTDINGWKTPGDTLEVVFLERRNLSVSDKALYKEETGYEILSPLWLVITMDDRRKRVLWFENTEGLIESPDDDIFLGDLLVPRNSSIGQDWQWTPNPDNRRTVVAIKDTIISGISYESIIEVSSTTHQGEHYLYGWVKNHGLIYYSTNWIRESMGKISYSIQRIGDIPVQRY